MPGLTAYAGLHLIGKPQPRETVVVTAASGPVGSLVGQLAKLAGARAVGIAGGAEKCAFVKDDLRFDAAVDHRAADFPAQLAAACPNGIDVYFENVGGAIWRAVLPLLSNFARVPVCGLIAQYNGPSGGDGTDRLPATMLEILSKSLTLRGFINYDWLKSTILHSCARSEPASPTAASATARISSTVWRRRPKPLSACWKDATLAS